MFLEEPPAPGARYVLRLLEAARPVATTVELALTRAARRRGLLGRSAMPADAALVLAPCRAIHTWGLRMPIDVLFTARDGRILRVCGSVPPWRVRVAGRAYAAIELAAGAARAQGIAPGARLALDPAPWAREKG